MERNQKQSNPICRNQFIRLYTDLSKIFHIKDAARIEGVFEVFNLFNAENPDKFRGDLDSATFGTNTAFAGDPKQGDQRLAQIGFRIEF